MRKTNLSVDLDGISSRVALSDPEDLDIDLEAPTESEEQQHPSLDQCKATFCDNKTVSICFVTVLE